MGKARYSSHWSPHNPEAAGSSPAPAIRKLHLISEAFFMPNRVSSNKVC